MKNLENLTKEDFIYPKYPYYGDSFPYGLLHNANLQEFSHKVSYIVSLHTNGKISTEQAYQQIENLWQEFKRINSDFQNYF